MQNSADRSKSSQDIDLAEMYRKLRLIRRVEEEIIRLYPTDKIKSPVHLSIGQEAVAVGVVMALERTDYIFSNYRGHAHFLARSGKLNEMWAELYGKRSGLAAGKAGSMHLGDWDARFMTTSAIVTSAIPNAAGFALSIQMRRGREAVVCFHGEGAVDEGVYWETLNFAALRRLPLLMVCENNRYAIYTHQSRRMKGDNIVERAEAFGLTAWRVPDRRVESFRDATRTALAKIRDGEGPVLIECMTSRWRDHVGPGEDKLLGYRSLTELDRDIAEDEMLRVASLLPSTQVSDIDAAVENAIAEAIAFAEASPFPDSGEAYEHVWA